MKTKGFTLIELLAVIIILVIILAIAVPTVMGIIENTKKSAAQSSSIIYIRTVEKYQALCSIDKTMTCLSDGNYLVSNGVTDNTAMNIFDFLIPKAHAEITYVEGIYLNDIITVEGDKPISGYLTISGTKVSYGAFVIGEYKAEYSGNKVTITGKAVIPDDTHAPALTLKSTDTATIMRTTDNDVGSFYNITWAESGMGTLDCTDENNNSITNTNVLASGNHAITCKATGNTDLKSNAVTKNITITTAITTIDDKSYYLLYDAYELANFRDMVNTGSNTINAKLMANIDLNPGVTFKADGTISTGSATSWTPIGTTTYNYTGIFDGNNKSINNLYINNTDSMQGLFGVIKTGTIKNLTLNGSVHANYIVGGIAAYITNSTITNCNNYARVVALESTGGVVGRVVNTSNGITNVSQCGNYGEITINGYNGGGVVGETASGITNVDSAVNSGKVNGINNTGGIVGAADASYINVTNSYNTGAITGTTIAGGIVALNNAYSEMYAKVTITNCYNIGTVTANSNAGKILGLVAMEMAGSTSEYSINNTYYLNTLTGHTNYGGISKTSTELKSLAPTLGSSFKADSGNINNGYPILSWQ